MNHSRWRQHWPRAAVSVAMLAVALYALAALGESDFSQDYAAARGWWMGLDPNAPTATLLAACCPGVRPSSGIIQTAHPPAATLLTLPLALLTWPTARLLWCLLGWAAISWAWIAQRTGAWVCACTLAFWAVALSLGALEPLVFAALAGALLLHERRPVLAGSLLGAAAALKVYPALLIIGLWSAGRRRAAVVAAASLGAYTGLAELVLGHGVTARWLAYTPLNTLNYVDTPRNLSLVRVARSVLADISPLAAAGALALLLAAPLVLRLPAAKRARALVPVMLLASPLCWEQYLGMLALGPMGRAVLALLGSGGLLVLAVWLGFISGDTLAPLAYGPLTLALVLAWYGSMRQMRRAPAVEAGEAVVKQVVP